MNDVCYWHTFSVGRFSRDERDGRGSGPPVKVDIRSSENFIRNPNLQ